jgi:hypothetical protein
MRFAWQQAASSESIAAARPLFAARLLSLPRHTRVLLANSVTTHLTQPFFFAVSNAV